MSNVQAIYKELNNKRRTSMVGFILLNVLSFFLVAALVVLNLFAIRFNPDASPKGIVNDSEIIYLFVALSILSGLSSLFTSIVSFFVFRKRATKFQEQINLIKIEIELYKKSDGEYSYKDKDVLLIRRVTRIRNK